MWVLFSRLQLVMKVLCVTLNGFVDNLSHKVFHTCSCKPASTNLTCMCDQSWLCCEVLSINIANKEQPCWTPSLSLAGCLSCCKRTQLSLLQYTATCWLVVAGTRRMLRQTWPHDPSGKRIRVQSRTWSALSARNPDVYSSFSINHDSSKMCSHATSALSRRVSGLVK